MFENIGFVKKVEKKGSQFMRFKFTNFINQNGLDEFVENNVCKYKRKNENFIRLGHRSYKNGTTKALLPKETVTESPPIMKSTARFREEFAKIWKEKGELRERQRMFEEEAAKPDNSKAERQTVRAVTEGIMKDKGIDFGTFWAGKIQGNESHAEYAGACD